MCSHFVAAVRMDGVSHAGGPGLQGYYNSIGVAILGTVMDGDCGIDVACQMLGLPQTPAQRAALREEISDYLLARLKTPWMQELMGTLQEVDIADVRQILHGMADVPILAVASGGAIEDTQPHVAAAAVDQDTAVAVADQDTAVALADQELSRSAIGWATNSKDHAFITILVASLPPAVLDEQVRLYQASSCGPIVPHAPQAFVVYPHFAEVEARSSRSVR